MPFRPNVTHALWLESGLLVCCGNHMVYISQHPAALLFGYRLFLVVLISCGSRPLRDLRHSVAPPCINRGHPSTSEIAIGSLTWRVLNTWSNQIALKPSFDNSKVRPADTRQTSKTAGRPLARPAQTSLAPSHIPSVCLATLEHRVANMAGVTDAFWFLN